MSDKQPSGRAIPEPEGREPTPVDLTLFTERVSDLIEGDAFWGWTVVTEVFPDGHIGVILKGAGGQRLYFNIDIMDAA